MSRRWPALIRLLAAAGQDRADLRLSDFRAEQVRWSVTSGLGPWLRRCVADDPAAGTSPLWPLVQGADLTARVLVGDQLDAVDEIAGLCERHAVRLTLLKGISLCEQYYPEPHLRTMGDVDVLVDDEAITTLQSRLMALGYRPASSYPATFYDTHHHATPLFHPGRRVWVEIHRGLFPPGSPVGADRVFGRANVQAELRPSLVRGRRIHRLSDELQLVYLASHWAFGFRPARGLIGMLDVVRLLHHATLGWDRILGWLEGSFAATYAYALLTYLTSRGLADVPPEVLGRLFRHQRSLGRLNLCALHTVIDRYMVDGREFGPVMTERTVDVVWQALLSPGRPAWNTLRLGWALLPSRARIMRALTSRG